MKEFFGGMQQWLTLVFCALCQLINRFSVKRLLKVRRKINWLADFNVKAKSWQIGTHHLPKYLSLVVHLNNYVLWKLFHSFSGQ